jgi:pimeloyl-ACP methyl ester carboxylesterase
MSKYVLALMVPVILLASCTKRVTVEIERLMPRAVVKVNNQKTEISKTEGKTASIVFISGYDSEMANWQKVYAGLKLSSTVFTYNRACVGRSENITGPRDAKTIATELKAVLDANNIKPPYIFVTHSMGGIYARMFHHLYPGKIKGMVLVDATHERQIDSLLSFFPMQEQLLFKAELQHINDSVLNTMPAGALKEEFSANYETNYTQMKTYPAITNIPMYVITSTKVTEANSPFVIDIQKALHQQWALSAGSNGRFVTTGNSGHFIQMEEPKLVLDGIQWVLAK